MDLGCINGGSVWHVGTHFQLLQNSHTFQSSLVRAHGVVVSHPLSMREALGSIPSVSIFYVVEMCVDCARSGMPCYK